MNSQNNEGNKRLESNSILILQLGLLLSLIVVYWILQIKVLKDVPTKLNSTIVMEEAPAYVFPPFDVEQPKEKTKKPLDKKPKLLDQFLIDDIESEQEDIIEIIDSEPIDYDSIFENVPVIEEPIDEVLPFILVEQAPRYPGCNGKSEEDFKECFSERIKKDVARKFNPNVHTNGKGKQRIMVQFTIDKNGDIKEVMARASQAALEKEAIRVIKSFPTMEPGEQRGRPVQVTFSLPISLYLSD